MVGLFGNDYERVVKYIFLEIIRLDTKCRLEGTESLPDGTKRNMNQK